MQGQRQSERVLEQMLVKIETLRVKISHVRTYLLVAFLPESSLCGVETHDIVCGTKVWTGSLEQSRRRVLDICVVASR